MLEEIKTFISVVEYKNFTKAGLHLNLSQPSVSTHIKNLENYFGTTLIDRSIKQKTISITESGNILYHRAKEMVNLLETTYQEVVNVSDSIKGHIKVGASFTIGEYILPKFLAKFSKKYPDIEVEVFIENTSKVCSKLSDLHLDVGLIEGNVSYFNFNQTYFYEDEMVLALPHDSHLLKKGFSIDKLQSQNWIAREGGSGTRQALNQFLSSNEIVPRNIMVFGSNYSVKEAVRNNLGITIISHLITSSVEGENQLITFKLDNTYNRHFSYILPKNITSSKVCSVFLKELNKYTAKLD